MSLVQGRGSVVPSASFSASFIVGGLLGLVATACGATSSQVATGYGPASPAAGSASHAAMAPEADRPGLGTSWGESIDAPISFTSFDRDGAAPWAEVMFHYNDAAGVGEHARYLGSPLAPLELDAGDGALTVAVVDEDGRTLPGFTTAGRTLIMGEDGARYRIVVRNRTAARFEIVTSVDGLDVIDGQPADPGRRGYLIDPRGTLTIDGFRTSDRNVAAFRFGRVAESYAAQTSGDRNVGVIGLAIYAEHNRYPAPTYGYRAPRPDWTPDELGRRDSADPFPDRGYAQPPR